MIAKVRACVEIQNYYGAFVLNRRVDLHAINATPARWRDDAGSSRTPDALIDFHTGPHISIFIRQQPTG